MANESSKDVTAQTESAKADSVQRMVSTEYHEWNATHSGWILFAPILLANIEEEAPVPIPRWRLWWWYEINMWINDNLINFLIGLVNPEAVGYMFWGVRELKQSKTIRVPVEC